MNLLSLLKTQPEAATSDTLQDVLVDLARYGQPRVGQYGKDGTWHCTVEANITPVGAKFEVRSDYKHTTPMHAALLCRERLVAAIAALGAKP